MNLIRNIDKQHIKEMSIVIGQYIDQIGEIKNLISNTDKSNKRDLEMYRERIRSIQSKISVLDNQIDRDITTNGVDDPERYFVNNDNQ